MKLDEFEDVYDYPKHNMILSVLGVVLVGCFMYISIIKGTQVYYCVPFLWFGVRIYHFSFLGYNNLLFTIYYTYIQECRKRHLNIYKYKEKCVEKYKEVKLVKRYIYSFYKSGVSGLHNILTVSVIGIVLVIAVFGQIKVLEIKSTLIEAPSGNVILSPNEKLVQLAKSVEQYTGVSLEYEVLYGVSDEDVSYLSTRPQLGVVTANSNIDDIGLVIYVDTYLSEVVAIEQQFNQHNLCIATFVKDRTLDLMTEQSEIPKTILNQYPNFRVVHVLSEFKLYQ